MSFRKARPLTVCLFAVLLVFGQFIAAAYACPQEAPGALATLSADSDMSPDCAKQMNDKPSPACKAHCDQSSQSNLTPSLVVPPIALVALWALTPFDKIDTLPATRSVPTVSKKQAGVSPPLRVQYQVFRN